MKILFLALLLISTSAISISPWLEKLTDADKQEQINLRWVASGGEMDIQFIHSKLATMKIELSPKPQHPQKAWTENHLVYTINKTSKLNLQVPYGSIEKVTDGKLIVDTQFSLTVKKQTIKVTQLSFVPNTKKDNDIDIVTFKLYDQNNHHLFNTDHVHIQYSKDRKLLQMKHMDISATKELADLLHMPEINGQLLGQVNAYSYLDIPKKSQLEIKGGNCLTSPNFQNLTNFTDVELVNMASIHWVGNVAGTDKLILVPSAELHNVGTADIPWLEKFTTDYIQYIPEQDNNQHPFLNWAVYREIDNRFEQIGISGLKHAFFSTNSGCSCPSGNVLGVGCGDVYGLASNNNVLSSLGPREELNAFTGIWESCGSFFDPLPCTGSLQNTSGPTTTGENRLTIEADDIIPELFMQAWYIVRDDINIFNSMGYKKFSPTLLGSTWVMNVDPGYSNGAAIDNYVTPNSISSNEISQTQSTNEGHFTVAVKVIDLGNSLFRYNYAIENYDFDPRFDQFSIPLIFATSLGNTIFSDSDNNEMNDWVFDTSDSQLHIVGNPTNEQDWGQLFSFSFTIAAPPKQGTMTINVASPILNNTVSSLTLVPDMAGFIFVSSFE